MSLRISLPVKIVFLALVNFLLIAAALLVYAGAGLRFDIRSVFWAPAIDRILAASRLLELELGESPASARPELLQRYSETYGVTFRLFDIQGRSLVEPGGELPAEVRQQISGPFRIAEEFGQRGGGRGQPGPDPSLRGPGSPPGPAWRFAGGRGRGGRGGAPPLTFVRSTAPVEYWAVLRIPVPAAPGERPSPGFVAMSSDSVFGNGFFFDPTPWVVVSLGVILISVIVWLPFLRGLTRSISQISRATQRIADGEFDVPVETSRQDELGQLGMAVHRMGHRLDGFVKGQKRFLADIAHELSSPVARMQFAVGLLERKADDEQRENVADLQDELQHMSGLINELLQFSKAGMLANQLKLVSVNVADTVRRVLERESGPGVEIESRVDDGIFAVADQDYLYRALSNVVRNAIRYAGDAGPIVVAARREKDDVVLTVTDSGRGLPEDALENVFAPFYRPEAARNRETGGVGLGLAIVRACVEACKGTVVARNRKPSGLEIEMRIPGVL